MLLIEKISANHEGFLRLEKFLKSIPINPLFFYSPISLITWFTSQKKSLYIANFNNERSIIIHHEERGDIRFLLTEPTKDFIKAAIDHFSIKYVGVNDLFEKPRYTEKYEKFEEIILDVDTVAELKEPSVKKKYYQFLRKHPDLTLKQFDIDDFEGTKTFLEKWSHSRTEKQNKFAKIHNDLNFISHFGNHPSTWGGVVIDKEEIVAITFFVPLSSDTALAVINKVLRGYTQLGAYIFVERAKQMKKAGFKKVNIGTINNDFKKNFLLNAIHVDTYAYEAWIKDGENFTQNFLERFL